MSNEFGFRIIIKPNYYIELVALLNRIVEDRTYEDIVLNKEQNEFLDLLKGTRYKGFELFEIRLYQDKIDDIASLEKLLLTFSKIDFLYAFFDDDFTKEEIADFIERYVSNDINHIPSKSKLLAYGSRKSISFLLSRTDEFINNLIDIFKIISNKVSEQLKNQAAYMDGIQKVGQDLRTKIPLEVAQSIMGKRFKRIYDFNTYYFVPSYYYMCRPRRVFNDNTQIVVYSVHKNEKYNKAELTNALRIIGDATRLDIIEKLSSRAMYGKELADELGLVNSTVSHHLEQLRSIGLINEERVKSVKYFNLNINEYNNLCNALRIFIFRRN